MGLKWEDEDRTDDRNGTYYVRKRLNVIQLVLSFDFLGTRTGSGEEGPSANEIIFLPVHLAPLH